LVEKEQEKIKIRKKFYRYALVLCNIIYSEY